MTEKPAAETATAAAPKKGKWLKRVAITAFAVAVGALALDDLGLRLENEELATGVDMLLEENAALKDMVQEGGKGGGEFIVIPRENNRKIEISAPARVAKPLAAGQTI